MLENLWFKEEKKKKFLQIYLFSAFFTVVSIFLTRTLLPFSEGLVSVFMVSLAAAYPTIRFLKEDEEEEISKRYSEGKLLERHVKEIGIFLAVFLGALTVFLIAEFFVSPQFFMIQKDVIKRINPSVPLRGMVSVATNFWAIIQNNLWVFAITFLVSFFISAGGIFVIVWNASILGVFLSNLIMGPGCPNLPAILAPTCYMVHGILEIIAYIIAGIAGSLFSKQFSLYFFRKIVNEEVFMRIWKDVTILVSIGVLLIFVAGAVEVF